MAKVRNFVCFFLILIIFDFCVSTNIQSYYQYEVDSDLPNIGPSSRLGNFRVKRETLTDVKNQYQSVAQNVTSISSSTPTNTNTNTSLPKPTQDKNTSSSVVVPMGEIPIPSSERPQLGVNGTGQRKDIDGKQKTFPKKVLLGTIPTSSAERPAAQNQEDLIGNVDVADEDTINNIKQQNYTVNRTMEDHKYYNSTMYLNKAEADAMWSFVKNHTHNSMLSQSHRRAMTVELSFDFPFYGHSVRNITVATGGFLYTGEYVHSWLAATQYIAPLMANFDTSLSNDSFVRLNDNGTAFTVVWENVSLQDRQNVGKFTFSTTLHKNGDICFAYYSVPILVNAIEDDKHPVKVGLSDAYILDKIVYLARRKTIFEYHRVSFASAQITNSTIIYLTALPTCIQYTDCSSCIKHQTSFACAWCPAFNRCSNGVDRKKQEWMQKGCESSPIIDVQSCPAIGQKGNNANQTNSNSADNSKTTMFTPTSNSNNKDNDNHQKEAVPSTSLPVHETPPVSKEMKAPLDGSNNEQQKSMGLALGFTLPICFVVIISLWVLYAYRNPHTKSGQLLIQYRPGQWSWRRGEARYTAATIHM